MKYISLILQFLTFGSAYSQIPEFLWARSVGGTGETSSKGIAVDNSGQVYVCGYYTGNNDFDPGMPIYSLVSHGREDIYVQKLDKNGNFLWALNFGDTMNDRALSISTDDEGTMIICGTFQGTVDFDPSATECKLSAHGKQDAFVLKLNTEGKFLWVAHLGGTGSVVCTSITNDVEGNTLLTGYFSGDGFTATGSNSMAISSDQTPNYATSSFICKLKNSGEFLWLKQIKSSKGKCIKSDKQGNVYVGGTFLGMVDFDPGEEDSMLYSNNNECAFFLKLGPQGNFVWANQLTGSPMATCGAIELNDNNQLLAIGSIYNAQSIFIFTQAFVLCLNAKGQIEWQKEIGGKKYDYGYGLAVNSKHEIFITGCFQDTVDFDPGEGLDLTIAKSSADIFILKLDSLGGYLGKGIIVGTPYTSFLLPTVNNYSTGISVLLDKNDNVFVSGKFYRFNDFDTGEGQYNLSPVGDGDMYLLKIGKKQLDEAIIETCFHLFPNPCNDKVFLTGASIGSACEVFDTNGKLVITAQILENSKEINLEGLAVGIYFFRVVKKDEQIITLKIIKL